MTLLRSALEDAEQGLPSVILVTGDAGVGKTRLVREVEAVARNDGMLAMRGECLELLVGELPYAPIAAALRDADQTVVDAALSELPRDARHELARVFPDTVGESPAEITHDDRFGQSRLFGWILLLLRHLATKAAVLLTIEDLHCSDTSSRDFLRFLVQSLRSERLIAIATVRSDDLHREHPVRALVAELSRSESVSRIHLAPLSEEAVERQVAGILGTEPPRSLVRRLFTRGEGNPFYTEELLAAGASEDEELPPTLRDALLLRTDTLDDRSRKLIRLVAAVGRPVDDAFLEAATHLPRDELEAALRECINRNVLVCDRRTGSYSGRHALFREAIYGDMLPAERAALHRTIAQTLEQTAPGGNARRPSSSLGSRARAITRAARVDRGGSRRGTGVRIR